jgi:hypothetical protein
MRLRGGDDPDASDSEPDETLDLDVRDSDFIMSFSAIPDDCIVKAAKVTSGHSQDRLRIVIDEIKPGTRQIVKLRARNVQGLSEFTAVSNIVQSARKYICLTLV